MHEYFIETINQPNGMTIELDVHRMKGIGLGTRVWLNDLPAPNGTYRKGFFSKIEVTEGKISKIK